MTRFRSIAGSWILLIWAAGAFPLHAARTGDVAALPPAPERVADEIVAHAVHHPSQVSVGDPIQIEMAFYYPTNAILDPLVLDPSVSGFDWALIDRSVSHSESEAFKTTRMSFRIAAFEVGGFLLSTGTVEAVVAGDDGKTLSTRFPPIEIEVVSVLEGDDETLRPAKEVQELELMIPREVIRTLLVIAGILLAIALVYVGVWLLLRNRKKRIEAPPLPDPYATALLALGHLRSQSMQPEDAEAFFVQLSRIIRKYLEGRFGLHAPEMTTEEFIREASVHAALSDAHKEATAAFLTQSDMVKFAQFQADEALMRTSLDAAERLVKETKPAAAPPARTPEGTA